MFAGQPDRSLTGIAPRSLICYPAGLVIVFPSSKAASIALGSLLVDPDATEGPMTAQRVPTSLWPSEFKKNRHPAKGEDQGMEIDDADESSAVMEGHLEVRWARIEDKKARTNVSLTCRLPILLSRTRPDRLVSLVCPPTPSAVGLQLLPQERSPRRKAPSGAGAHPLVRV